ncbi:MAG: hypothetical protein NTW16_05740 [Bacteroidetes bacterium]|nr:hypothetical protein [Bacteroidota bacterium]
MNRVVILIACISLLGLFGCKSSRVTSLATHEQAITFTQDSCYDRETVHLDSIIIPLDSVSTFLPMGWIADTLSYQDPAPISQKQGRATLKIERKPGGIRVTASCDSLLQLLVNRNREIFNLHSQLNSQVSSSSQSDRQVQIITKVPLWAIILLVVSLAINVIIIVYQIKTRLL